MASTEPASSEQSNDIKVLDGGLASELSRLGYASDNDPLWSSRWLVKDPSAVMKVHTGFLESGADVIETASYQASINGLCEWVNVSVEKAKEIIQSSVVIAKQARDSFWEKFRAAQENSEIKLERPFPLVAGSVGPYGAALHDGSEYTGDYVQSISIEDLMDWHRPRFKCLVRAGADMIAMETIPAAKEGKALLNLLREFPNVKAWLSFSCKDDISTSYGDSFESVVKMCVNEAPQPQLIGVGVNCLPPHRAARLLESASAVRDYLPFVVYPNSGEQWVPQQGWQLSDDVIPLHGFVDEWISYGANMIGGCCRVTPADIASIRDTIRGYKKTS